MCSIRCEKFLQKSRKYVKVIYMFFFGKKENFKSDFPACKDFQFRFIFYFFLVAWIPEMCLKYPTSLLNDPSLSNAACDTIKHFHNFKFDFPQKVLTTHRSIITCCILKDQLLIDQNIGKRLMTVLLAALRSNGSFGAFCCINRSDNFLYDFYSKLGFVEMYSEDSKIYLGRIF